MKLIDAGKPREEVRDLLAPTGTAPKDLGTITITTKKPETKKP